MSTPRFIVRGRFVDPNGVDLGPAPKGGGSEQTVPTLPDDFPERDLLVGTPFKTLEALKAASDEDLLAVDGIGPAKLRAIRAALRG